MAWMVDALDRGLCCQWDLSPTQWVVWRVWTGRVAGLMG